MARAKKTEETTEVELSPPTDTAETEHQTEVWVDPDWKLICDTIKKLAELEKGTSQSTWEVNRSGQLVGFKGNVGTMKLFEGMEGYANARFILACKQLIPILVDKIKV